MFKNRIDAGKQLAAKLKQFKGKTDTLIIGLPRGGVPVAFEIAEELHLPLDVVCPRKIGAPTNKEFAIGAITETGEGVFNEEAISRLHISKEYIQQEIQREKIRAQMRLAIFRKGRPPREVEGKTVILVDDGLATGATMKAAIKSLLSQNPEEIIVAIPVSSREAFEEIREMADAVVCIDIPPFFEAVGQFYVDFSAVEDEEVAELMQISEGS